MKKVPTLLLLAMTVMPLAAYETLESDYRTNGPLMHSVVQNASQSLQDFSVVIYDGRKEAAYGIVVSDDGYVVSKWSELREIKDLKVRIGSEQYTDVKLISGDSTWDVCLLKVAATGLKPAVFADNSELAHGSWVVTNGATTRSERRPMIGIISANSREIPAEGGAVLGVEIAEEKSAIMVGNVPEVSGAFKAGIRKGDKILQLGDQKITKREDVVEAMKKRRVGEKLDVMISRDGKEQTFQVELMGRADTFGVEETRNDAMSGAVSKRRSGFPRVLQHDTLGNNSTVGGPLLDLDGKCVGMNIARANRAESFAIPVEELRQVCDKLVQDAKKQF